MRFRFTSKNYRPILVIFILFISILTSLIVRFLEKPFTEAYTSFANKASNDAVNEAVMKCFDNTGYSDLIELKKDKNGNIVSAGANTFRINKIKSNVVKEIDKNIRSFSGTKIKIHLLGAQKNIIFSSLGPFVKVRVEPYSTTVANFRDEFESVGINQVRHSIYLDITSTMTITALKIKRTHKVDNTILIADTIIVGKVPEFYGGLNYLKG